MVGLTKGFLRGKALSVEGHVHDDRYFTEAEMNNLLSGKAPSSHNHDASQIVSGILPVTRGGTGVTSIDALKNVLGIGSSGNSISKMVAGTYTGNSNYNIGDSGTQIIIVNGLTILKGIIVVNGDGLFGWSSDGVNAITYAGIAGIKTDNTEVSTTGVEIIPNTNTFEVTTLRRSSYDGMYLNNRNDLYMYLAFGN